MDDRILVPFDGSPLSRRALDRAVTAHQDATITVLYVIDPVYVVYEAESRGLPEAETWHDRMEAQADELCTEAEALAEKSNCTISTEVVTGKPAREILAFAEANDIDHIIMGSHGRSGVSRLVLGSVAETVMRQSPVPVTIVR